MHVKEIMTPRPACCTSSTPLREVAKAMVQNDCGEIPVVDGGDRGALLGVITDRDIVCRIVAEGKNPLDHTAADCMSTPVVVVWESTQVEDCARLMEEHQIRRVPVVDGGGACCGIVSQADIAQHASRRITAELVRDVSQPGVGASRV
jgi:CBS domain-containing protein